MKTKKSKKANLENFRTLFFQIGTIITLAAILFAFEWNSTVKIDELESNGISWSDTEELPPVTMPKPEIKEVKPPSFEIEIIDDHKKIDFEEDIHDIFKGIEEYDPISVDDFDDDIESVNEDPLIIAEIMPTFQGKDLSSFRDYVAKNVVFPERAKETGVSGTVYASFVVDKSGNVTNVVILRGVHPDVDNAVIKVIKNSPKWEPGVNNGRLVKVQFTIPVSFQLM